MRRAAIAAIVWLAAGCGVASMPPPGDAARVDAGLDSGVHDAGADAFANDAGMDASDLDAGRDANDLDANDLDAGRDANDLDAGLDASDAWVSIDTNPPDANTVRTYDPPTSPSATPIAPFTTCTVTTASDTIFAGHLPPCSPLPYAYEPPSNGLHYWFWAAYRTYTTPVPWGFLVHDLEHGAVVLAYHCANDADCNPVRAEFASIIASQGVDPICRLETAPSRFIVVPDPNLPVPIAAVAWGHVYEATCLDPPSLRAFVSAHYGMGSEAYCGDGITEPDGGWCP